MSIFEPIPRESHSDGAQELDDAAWDDDATRGSLDPRSIWIAGLVGSGIVAVGLVVSNAAEPEPRPRTAVASRVDPGAAAVERAEAQQRVSAGPSASASTEPVDEVDDADAEDVSGWRESKERADKPGKPGRGHGHGRD